MFDRRTLRGSWLVASLAATLAWAAPARADPAGAYRLEGVSRRLGPIAGSATFEPAGADTWSLTRRLESGAEARGRVRRGGDALRGRLAVGGRRGLRGALSGGRAPGLVLEVELREAGAGVLESRWRLLGAGDPPDVLDQGQETLSPPRGPAAPDASPRLEAIAAAVAPVAQEGTVSPHRVVTRGWADPRPLLRGPAIFEAHARRIEEAQEEVLLQTYVWESGSLASEQLLDALLQLEARRRREGEGPVRVRVVVNASHRSGDSLQEARRDVEGLGLDPAWVDARVVGHSHTLLGSLHGKSLVVDGARAIVTGGNVEAVHDAGQPWFEAGFQLEGEVAAGLREDVAQAWFKVTGETLPALARRAAPVRSGARLVPMLIATRRADGNPFANSVDHPLGQAYLAALDGARERIRLQTPNLNDDAIKAALLRALERGVVVELVLSRGFNAGAQRLPGQGGDNRRTVRELYDAAGRLGPEAASRLRVRWYSHDGREAVDGNVPTASHAKYASVDGRVAIVGSANLDTQSMNHSREVNVVVEDAATTAAWDRALFEPKLRRGLEAPES